MAVLESKPGHLRTLQYNTSLIRSVSFAQITVMLVQNIINVQHALHNILNKLLHQLEQARDSAYHASPHLVLHHRLTVKERVCNLVVSCRIVKVQQQVSMLKIAMQLTITF